MSEILSKEMQQQLVDRVCEKVDSSLVVATELFEMQMWKTLPDEEELRQAIQQSIYDAIKGDKK